jgi:ABC-2 type transport system ATP-binding protein
VVARKGEASTGTLRAMIRALGLVRDFPGSVRAVDGLTFEAEPGEIYGLLGPNGAGKTTAMRLLSALLRPSAGSAVVAGFSVKEEPREVRARIGILTEVPGLYLRLTPAEYLDFFAQVQGMRLVSARNARVEEMLRLVGLWDRRGSVMRTLIQDPPVLLFDEPTAALDPEAARSVRDYVRELAASRGRTVLLCTHNLPEAEQLCQRLSIIQAGRQVAEGTPAALKSGVATTCVLRVRERSPLLLQRLRDIAEIDEIVLDGPEAIMYRTRRPLVANPIVVRAAISAGADVLGLAEAANSLEDVYLSIVAAPPATASPSGRALSSEERAGEGSVAADRSPSPQPAPRGSVAILIAIRELKETLRDPNLVLPLVLMPCLIGVLAGISAFASFAQDSTAVGAAVTNAALDQLPQAAVQRLSNLPTNDRHATIETLLKAFSIPLFWIIPVALIPALAADSFVGERERSSLEPLLATPIGTGQLLLGKLAAAVIPAAIGTWLGVLVFWAVTLLSGSTLYPRVLLADGDWLFSLLVVTPLVALFTAGVAALISTRVSGYRVAYQLNGLIVLPVVLLLLPITAFLFLVTGAALAYVAALFAVLDIAIVVWANKFFDRERLLSRR